MAHSSAQLLRLNSCRISGPTKMKTTAIDASLTYTSKDKDGSLSPVLSPAMRNQNR